MNAKIVRKNPEAELPKYLTAESAAFDLAAAEDVVIAPHAISIVGTGFVIQGPPGHFLLLAARSSLATKKGLLLGNGIGIIDRDYSGPNDEVKIQVFNFTDQPVSIAKGERIAQGMFLPHDQVTWDEVKEIDAPDRGGFGGTGGYKT